MSKKKKKSFSSFSPKSAKKAVVKKPSLKEWFKIRKASFQEIGIIFTIVFAVCLTLALFSQPIDTHKAYGDNYYYHENAVRLTKIWKQPFHYIPSLLTKSLSNKEVTDLGLNKGSLVSSVYRAPSFIFFHSFWIFIFGDSELSNLISQVFLLSFILVLVYMILKRYTGRTYALFGLIFSLTYLPYHIASTITMTELFQAASIFVLFWISERIYIQKDISWKKGLLLGLMILTVSLSKSSLKYSPLFIIPGFLALIFFHWEKKKFFKAVRVILISCLVFFALWGRITSNGPKASGGSNALGWLVFWAGGIPEAEGLIPSGGVHNLEFRENVSKGTDTFFYTRYAEICRPAMIKIITSRPVEYAVMVVNKLSALLYHPSYNNDYQSHLLKLRMNILRPYHIIFFVLALLGLVFLSSREYLFLKYFLLILLSYFFVIYGMANPSTRFFLPLVPLYTLCAVLFLHHVFKSKQYTLLLPLVAVLLAHTLFFKDILVRIIPDLRFIQIFRLIGLLLPGTLVLLLFKRTRLFQPQARIGNIFIFTFYFTAVVCLVAGDRQLNHFRLPKKTDSISQTIILNPEELDEFRKDPNPVQLALDIYPFKKNSSLEISLNGQHLTNCMIYNAVLIPSEEDAITKRTLYNINKWIYIPVDPLALTLTNTFNLSSMNRVSTLFRISSGRQNIPSLLNWFAIKIVHGLKTRHDGRFFFPLKVYSSERVCRINGKIKPRMDMNIFLLRKEPGDYYLPEQYAQLNDAPVKYTASMVNPVDQGVVIYSETDPGPDFIPASGKLRLYLISEIDRYKSGYRMY